MSDKQKLKRVIDLTFWMAIRYAHGRHTYAPLMIREAFELIKEVYSDYKLKEDITIEPPTEEDLEPAYVNRKEYLDDLFKEVKDK